LPTVWLTTVTMTAGWQKLFHENPSIGFLAAANKYQTAAAAGEIIAPAQSLEEMNRIVLNNQIDAVLTGIFMLLVLAIILDALRIWYKVLIRGEKLPLMESPYIPWNPKTAPSAGR